MRMKKKDVKRKMKHLLWHFRMYSLRYIERMITTGKIMPMATGLTAMIEVWVWVEELSIVMRGYVHRLKGGREHWTWKWPQEMYDIQHTKKRKQRVVVNMFCWFQSQSGMLVWSSSCQFETDKKSTGPWAMHSFSQAPGSSQYLVSGKSPKITLK